MNVYRQNACQDIIQQSPCVFFGVRSPRFPNPFYTSIPDTVATHISIQSCLNSQRSATTHLYTRPNRSTSHSTINRSTIANKQEKKRHKKMTNGGNEGKM